MRIFISAELSTESISRNVKATRLLEKLLNLKGISYSPVQGSYQGATESSCMVEGGIKELDVVRQLARLFSQDSILIVDNENRAMLQYMHGAHKTESIGTFKQVDTVDGLGAYSVIDGKFYTCA